MKQNIKVIIILALVLSFAFVSSCKRKALEEPSPFGPSSLSTILTLSANPNVITASTSRQAASITASFRKYDGTPIANTDIYFEIRNSAGARAYIGYFEGNQSVATKTTNSNGKARATYYGPLADELTGNSTVYIYASASWKGEEFVYEFPNNITVENANNKFVSFEENRLAIKPWHIYEGKIKIETVENSSTYTCKGIYFLDLKVNPYIDENGTQFVYYKPINDHATLVCEESPNPQNEDYLCPYNVNNFAYLDAKYEGVKKAITKVEELTRAQPLEEDTPIRIHLNASPPDSPDPYAVTIEEWRDQRTLAGYYQKNNVYVFWYEWAKLDGVPYAVNCLNLENPTEKPTKGSEVCGGDENVPQAIIDKLWRDPTSLADQVWIVHEYMHALNKIFPYALFKYGTKINIRQIKSLSKMTNARSRKERYHPNANGVGPLSKSSSTCQGTARGLVGFSLL